MFNKYYWTKLTKKFNDYAAKTDWKKPRIIQVEHIGFFKKHVGHRGLNHNESRLLEFGTRLIEAEAIHFAYTREFNSVHVYIRSTIYTPEAGTYIEFVKDGKTYSATMYDRGGENDVPYSIEKVLGKGVDCDLFQAYAQIELKEKLEATRCNVLVFFRFTTQMGMNIPHHSRNYLGQVDYIRETKQGIELGWIASGTYNSLPNVVRIKRITAIPTVKLSDLGIERKGYYSHDMQCTIPKAQAQLVKRFFGKRFKHA
jgi:hypothetical protein